MFEVDSSRFRSFLSDFGKIPVSGGPIPVLAGIKLTTHDGRVEAYASSIEIGRVASLGVTETKPASAVVDYKRLMTAVSGMSGTVVVTRDDKVLSLRRGGTKVNIPLMSEDLPAQVHTGDYTFARIDAGTWKTAFRFVENSVATDVSRPTLTGVCIGEHGFCATDGHRLDVFKIDVPSGWSAIVPSGVMREICSLTAGDDGSIGIGISGGKIVAESSGCTVWGSLIDGVFPSFSSVVPDFSGDDPVVVDRVEFLSRTKFVGKFAQKKLGSVAIRFGGDAVTLTGSDPDAGDATETIQAECPSRDEITISVNHTYVSEALETMVGTHVEIYPRDTLSPVVIRDRAAPAGTFKIVMPMRM